VKYLLLALAALALLGIAAVADTAVQIATVIMVVAPLVLPMILKYVPLSGWQMTVLAYAVSLGVAIAAGSISGLFTGINSVPGIIAAATAMYGLMQIVYNLFKDHGTFGKLLV
jgi:hypothetical protein